MSRPQTLSHGFLTPSDLTCLLPGLTLTAMIALAAFGARTLIGIPFLSPLMFAMVIGIAIRNVGGMQETAQPGTAFVMKRLLRFAIILLGLQLTFTQIQTIGVSGIAILTLCTTLTFVFTKFAGKALKVDPKLSELIAAGTSICGASAIIATNTVTKGNDEDVAYAITCVTLFGSVAVMTYPLLATTLDMAPQSFGMWAGASIHEIAQVVATSYQQGQVSGEFGTIAKLSRVLLLAPMVMILGAVASRKTNTGSQSEIDSAPWPWFILGFVALIFLNSIFSVPSDLKSGIASLTTALLTMSLAAMGLSTDIGKLKAKGPRPLLLGMISFIFISGLSLGLISLLA